MEFEKDVIDRLARLEEKFDSMEKKWNATKNTVVVLSGAFIIALSTIIVHLW